ncbi:hypothetical protein [Pseudomonas nitroreducens]|uniref:hypothetical protein n=1 Tax=Pseudomonas nitroreducens TaxID=46680 RepID=UPI00209E9810|nr:hypothetical protein [Pseudomonas nitroreducens]MCP1626458.1 hypothetical protein [Pseudomonas nitroreducens]
MDDIFDFASILIKLVLILSVALLSGFLVIAPDKAIALAPSMLFLGGPLFVLTMVLDLAGLLRRLSAGRVATRNSSRWNHD